MQVQCQYTLKWNFIKTEFESLKTQSEDWFFFLPSTGHQN